MPEAFGKPTFVRVGKKRTPKLLQPPTTVRPPTSPDQITRGTSCASFTSSSTTTHSVSLPSGALAGDFCFLFIQMDNGPITSAPSGWDLEYAADAGGDDYAYCYTKILTSSDISSPPTYSTSLDDYSSGLSVYFRGAVRSDLTLAGPAGMATAEHDPPAITPSQGAGDYTIMVIFHENKGDFPTDSSTDGPTGYTVWCEVDGPSGGTTKPSNHLWYAEKTITAGGNENPSEITWSDTAGSRKYATATISIPLSGGDGELATGDHTHLTADEAAITVEKAGTLIGTRPRLNFIEGTDITLAIADDATDDEIDITITSTASGGGGSGENNAVYQHADYPGSADAFDEEFDTDPTAGWTWLNQSTATVSVGNSVLTLSDSRNTNNVSFIGVAPPSAQDYTIETLCYPWLGDPGTNRSMGALAVRHGSTITGVGFYIMTQLRTIQWASNGTGTSAAHSTSYNKDLIGPHFLRAVWDNTAGTLKFEASFAGDQWFTVHSYTPGSTPDLIGFAGLFEQNNEINYAFEYLRRTA